METLITMLREGRESKGLLLREVAAAIGVDTAMISKFEKGERKPTRDQLLLLSKTLDIDERAILVTYLSDKVVADLVKEDVANEVLEVAMVKINAIKK
ncbi:transcriptional regulator with XRE-family HTH domain [Mucilaginibacter sp. UYNi724]